MRTNTSINKEIQQITGVIMGMVKTLATFPAHPSNPQYKGPLFSKIDTATKPAGKNDGMLGSVILDGMLGGSFTQAASEIANDTSSVESITSNTALDADVIADLISEYIEDRTPERGEGKGSFATTRHREIANDFNKSSMKKSQANAQSTMMDMYLAALPERMKIENTIAFYSRKLRDLKTNIPVFAPSLELAA